MCTRTLAQSRLNLGALTSNRSCCRTSRVPIRYASALRGLQPCGRRICLFVLYQRQAHLHAPTEGTKPLVQRAQDFRGTFRHVEDMVALHAQHDARLRAANFVSQAEANHRLAEAIGARAPEQVASALGATYLVLEHVFDVPESAAKVLRALDQRLGALGGGVQVRLPLVEYEQITERARDPFERLADDWTRQLEAAPVFSVVGTSDAAFANCRNVRLSSALDVARCAREKVEAWLTQGVPLDAICIVVPSMGSDFVGVLVEQLADLGALVHDADVVRVLMQVLRAFLPTGLAAELAAALRSHVVGAAFDPHALVRAAVQTERALAVLGGPLWTLWQRLAVPSTRIAFFESVEQMVTLLGFAQRVDQGALRTFRKDGKLTAVERAELQVLVRESRAFRVLEAMLEEAKAAARALDLDAELLTLREHLKEVQLLLPAFVRLPVAAEASSLRIALSAQGLGASHVILVDATEEAYGAPAGEAPFRDARLVSALSLCHESTSVYLLSVHSQDGATLLVPGAESEPYVYRYVRGASDERAEMEVAREGYFMDEKRSRGGMRVDAQSMAPWFAAPLSVTHAERYAQCEVRGLVPHVFRGKDVALDEHLPSALDEGTELHAMLARLFTHFRDALASPSRDPQALMLAARQLLLSSGTSLASLHIRELEETALRFFAEALLEPSWCFESAEVAFGAGKALQGAEVDGVHIEGRIDRIDSARDGKSLRVIDYKLRSVPDKRHLGERSLQVPIYMQVLQRARGLPVYGAYLAKGKQRELAPGEKVSESMESLANSLAHVRAGDLGPRPVHAEVCTTCAFDGVCRKPRFAVEQDE
jgi:RecB family exonuclease